MWVLLKRYISPEVVHWSARLCVDQSGGCRIIRVCCHTTSRWLTFTVYSLYDTELELLLVGINKSGVRLSNVSRTHMIMQSSLRLTPFIIRFENILCLCLLNYLCLLQVLVLQGKARYTGKTQHTQKMGFLIGVEGTGYSNA